jgi:hypothetical protein
MCLRWRRHTSVDGFFRKCSGLKLAQGVSACSPGTQGRNRGVFGHKFRALKMVARDSP